MDDIDFSSDDFADIVAKDDRYDARAYALLCDVVAFVSENYGKKKHHASGEEVLDEFKECVLDQYGPLAYTVLTEWGVKCTEDIGEMMFNLVDSHRIGRDDGDSLETFVDGYDFKETFLAPYQA